MMIYSCVSEVTKPRKILVHQPGDEVILAIEHPAHWGFYRTQKDSRNPYEWLKKVAYEHGEMKKAMEGEGIEVVELHNLLRANQDGCRDYLQRESGRALERLERLEGIDDDYLRKAQRAIMNAPYMSNPDETVLGGLERDDNFSSIPYKVRLHTYRTLQTLMPQASIYYTRDGVITTPKGLVKSKMGMWHRAQEPDIFELALGSDNYVHAFENVMEGGDTIMHEGQMFIGIGASSRDTLDEIREEFVNSSGVSGVIRFYDPDFFDPSIRYATGNLVHLDTYLMPVSQKALLANRAMMEKAGVCDMYTGRIEPAYDWALREFSAFIQVPNEEQKGLRWGTNVLPLGNRSVLTAGHHVKTNRNLRAAGFNTIEVPAFTLSEGYGGIHCMTKHLL